MALNLDKVKLTKAEAEKLTAIASNHNKLYKQKNLTADTILKLLKLEVTTTKRLNVANRLLMLFTTCRRAEEQREVTKWLAR